MLDPRCKIGRHNYVAATNPVPRVEGSIALECTRCHKGKTMRIPGAGPSGPIMREPNWRER